MYSTQKLAMFDKTLDANSSTKISRSCKKLLQEDRWHPKSKELIHKVYTKTLKSVTVQIKKTDLSVGPDFLNSVPNSSLIPTLHSK